VTTIIFRILEKIKTIKGPSNLLSTNRKIGSIRACYNVILHHNIITILLYGYQKTFSFPANNLIVMQKLTKNHKKGCLPRTPLDFPLLLLVQLTQ
jgi:hypothetical protein